MVQNFSSIEIEFFDKLREGHNTVELIKDNSSLSVNSINMAIDSLLAKNLIKFNKINKTYSFTQSLDPNKIMILDGNILLPVTIIAKDGKTFISRGNWYSFEGEIDVRNIIWNAPLPTEKNGSIELFELVKNSALKTKKSKIVPGEYHEALKNRIIPWSKNVTFEIITAGDEQIEVSIMFNFFLGNEGVFWRNLTVRTIISTEQLINQLKGSVADRDFSKIEVNRMYNVSDFIFAGNCFPTSIGETKLKFLKLTGVRGKIELTEFITDGIKETKTGEVYLFDDISEGLEYIRTIIVEKISPVINKFDFAFDVEDED